MWTLGIPAWIGIGCLAIAMGWLVSLFVRAPRGWQDQKGWHRDRRKPPNPDDGPWMRKTPPHDEAS